MEHPEGEPRADDAPSGELRFGPFRYDADDRTLFRGIDEVALPPRARDTLACLLRRPGKVVTKEELIDAVWGEVHVSDTALKEAVFLIRRALGDDPQEPSYVRTVHRRGYRFVAPIEAERPPPAPWPDPDAQRSGLRSSAALLLLLGAAVAAVAAWKLARQRSPAPVPLVRATLEVPSTQELLPVGLATSFDGRQVVYVGKDVERRLYLRRLDRPDPEPIAGTEGARRPFFSPDGRSLGFFADGHLRTVPVEGGTPRTLAEAPLALGGAWSPDGSLVFAGSPGGGLSFVAPGGEPRALTRPDTAAGEKDHRWPEVLPGGEAVLYTVWRGQLETARIARLDLATGESTVLVEGASQPRYLPPGFLLFVRGRQVLAARYPPRDGQVFDLAVPVLDGLETSDSQGAAELAVSPDGLAVYTPENPDALRTLAWLDHEGRSLPIPAAPARYQTLALAPDGARAALTAADGSGSEVWIVDLGDGGRQRLTFDGSSGFPVWVPDGERIVYTSIEEGRPRLMERRADGRGTAREVLTPGALGLARSVTVGGRLSFARQDPASARWSLWTVALDDDSGPGPVYEPDGYVRSMTLSPDGAWLAYEERTDGVWEVHLRRLVDPGGEWQISLDGGTEPSWAPGGGRLYYRSGQGLVAVAVSDGESFEAAPREPLLDLADALAYAPAPDRRRVLVLRPVAGASRQRHLRLILGWGSAELERRLRARAAR